MLASKTRGHDYGYFLRHWGNDMNRKQLIETIEAGQKLKYIFFWSHTPRADGSVDACQSRILMRPSEDRYGEGLGRLRVQQHCRVPLRVLDDRPARHYPRTGVFATDGSNPNTTT